MEDSNAGNHAASLEKFFNEQIFPGSLKVVETEEYMSIYFKTLELARYRSKNPLQRSNAAIVAILMLAYKSDYLKFLRFSSSPQKRHPYFLRARTGPLSFFDIRAVHIDGTWSCILQGIKVSSGSSSREAEEAALNMLSFDDNLLNYLLHERQTEGSLF